MINLLSSEARQELAAARRNVLLRQYTVIMLILGAVITASYSVGYLLLESQNQAYRLDAARYTPEKEKYKDVVAQAADYNKNLAAGKSIIDSEFVFSDLVTTLARTLPNRTVLTAVSLKASDLPKPIELSLSTISYTDAIAAKEAFESSPYFKDSKLRSVNFTPSSSYSYSTVLITTLDITAFKKAVREGTL